MLNGEGIIILLIAGLINKDLIEWVSTFHRIEALEETLK